MPHKIPHTLDIPDYRPRPDYHPQMTHIDSIGRIHYILLWYTLHIISNQNLIFGGNCHKLAHLDRDPIYKPSNVALPTSAPVPLVPFVDVSNISGGVLQQVD